MCSTSTCQASCPAWSGCQRRKMKERYEGSSSISVKLHLGARAFAHTMCHDCLVGRRVAERCPQTAYRLPTVRECRSKKLFERSGYVRNARGCCAEVLSCDYRLRNLSIACSRESKAPSASACAKTPSPRSSRARRWKCSYSARSAGHSGTCSVARMASAAPHNCAAHRTLSGMSDCVSRQAMPAIGSHMLRCCSTCR